jgi:antitoxin CcdA
MIDAHYRAYRSAQESVMPAAYKPKPVAAARLAERQAPAYLASKRRLNVTVRAELIDRARAAGLNLSSVLEESLTERLRKSDGERWLIENAEAIAYHNARIERDGPLCADLVSL